MSIYTASLLLGFISGLEQGKRVMKVRRYYERYPERLVIAEYIRRRPGAGNQEICVHLDKQEMRILAGAPKRARRPRPYPLPWEANPFEKREDQSALDEKQMSSRMQWAAALNPYKNAELANSKQETEVHCAKGIRFASSCRKNELGP